MVYDISKTCPAIHSAIVKPMTVASVYDTSFKSIAVGYKPLLAMSALLGIKAVAFEKPSLVIAFRTIFDNQEEISNMCKCISSLKDFNTNIENYSYKREENIYIPDKKVIHTDNKILLPIRKRGSKTGCTKNEKDIKLTIMAFNYFISENAKLLYDFSRDQIKFFVKEIMKNWGIGECFHLSQFKKSYKGCNDVNHKPGNHHGTKNKPELIVRVKLS